VPERTARSAVRKKATAMMINSLAMWLASVAAILAAFLLKNRRKGLAVLLLVLGFLGLVPVLYLAEFETPSPWVHVSNESGESVKDIRVSFSPVVVTQSDLAPGSRWGARIFPNEGAEITLEFRDTKGDTHTHKARLAEDLLFLVPELVIEKNLDVSWGQGIIPGE
jgi:hypothetical protein